MFSAFDNKAIKKYILADEKRIKTAAIGMLEDWFYTGETIYEDGKLLIDLDEKVASSGGVNGSVWATPTLRLNYEDGSYRDLDVGTTNPNICANAEKEQEVFIQNVRKDLNDHMDNTKGEK